MKKHFTIIMTLLICKIAHAQLDTAAMNKYLLSKPSKSELIQKWRSRTIEALVDGDKNKVEELIFYAKMDLEDTHYKAMLPNELWNMAIWLRKYDLAISEMSNYGFDSGNSKPLYNFNPTLYYLATDSIYVNKQYYIDDITSCDSIASADRDALLLYIEWMFSKKNNTKEINKKCHNYYNQYNSSQLTPFIKTFIHYEYKSIAPTIGVRLGLGAAIYTDDLGKALSNDFIGDFDLYVGYKNIFFDSHFSVQGGSTKQDIAWESGIMEKDERTSNNFFDINLGYRINLPYGIELTPSFGLGDFILSPSEKAKSNNTNLHECHYTSKPEPVLSVELGIHTFPNLTEYSSNDGHFINNNLAFTLKYTYRHANIDRPYFQCSGNIHTITIGYKIEMNWVKRVY